MFSLLHVAEQIAPVCGHRRFELSKKPVLKRWCKISGPYNMKKIQPASLHIFLPFKSSSFVHCSLYTFQGTTPSTSAYLHSCYIHRERVNVELRQ